MSKAQSIIEQFYQEEQARLSDEATFSPLDMSISSADMALISTIAKRFNKDRSLLAREALSQALLDMFSALDPVERRMLAKESDELATSIAAEIAEDQGLAKLDVSGTNWVTQDKNCVKAERKAEKEKAKLKEMNVQEPSVMEATPEAFTEEVAEETQDMDSEILAEDEVNEVETSQESVVESESTESPESIFA
jgi:hypothetical protein